MTALPPPTAKKLGLVIDLDTCVGCHACAVACKEWNDGGDFGPLLDQDPYGKEPSGVWFNRVHSYSVDPSFSLREKVPKADEGKAFRADSTLSSAPSSLHPNPSAQELTVHFPRSCLHCETPACVTVCPTGASYKRAEDGIVLVDADKCIGCQLCSWACPYGAREFSMERGTMQKCTLCVDRIYNETLDEEDRQPACVMACPTRARHFGDLGDENSAISRLVAERDGYALMPEYGYKPVNRYLPPRPRRDGCSASAEPDGGRKNSEVLDRDKLPGVLRWLDRALSR
ncbi:MAG: 4Fe-4S dicluster domain-containing protein [Dokdonella sp.]